MKAEEDDGDWAEFCSSHSIERRISRAIADDSSWDCPTLVQRAAIPVAMTGRDVLIQARTGSGKTGCYAIPMLQTILQRKDRAMRQNEEGTTGVLGIVLAPTRELVAQARLQILKLAEYCRDDVNVLGLMGEDAEADAKGVDLTRCDVVVATPAALNEACKAAEEKSLSSPLRGLGETTLAFVVDEADLVLSFGYEDDVESILKRVNLSTSEASKRPQAFLLSATLGDDVAALKRVALRKAATIRLKESAGIFGGDRDDEGALAQYYIPVVKEDKYLVVYVLLKLGLLQGRGILFVNDVDACYRLKLFLDLFSIRCLVLNAELPLASRLHTIESYNRGYYDLLVATDASVVVSAAGDADDEKEEEEEEVPAAKKKKRSRRDGKGGKNAGGDDDDDDAYGVSRGIDFQNVAWVLNVDFPTSTASYTHRVGRTARAGARGTALSLVASDDPADAASLDAVRRSQPKIKASVLATGGACEVVSAIGTRNDAEDGGMSSTTHVEQPVQLAFDAQECERFRYRVSDVKRGVTKASVREARAAELKREILNSKQLEGYFAANPNDLAVLKQERIELHVRRDLVAENVKHVPAYLVPQALRAVGAAPKHSFKRKKNPKHRAGVKRQRGEGTDAGRRKDNDPLQSFEAEDVVESAGAPRVYSGDNDADLMKNTVTSNRVKWKMKHRKGDFSTSSRRGNKKFSRGDTKAFGRKKL